MSATGYPTFAAGQRLTAAMMQAAVPLVATKGADQSITSNTTPQNDNDLLFTVASSASYIIDGFLMWIGNETGDIKFAFNAPTGSTLHWAIHGGNEADAGFSTGGTRGTGQWWAKQAQTVFPTGTIQYAGSTAILIGRIEGLLIVGGTSGTLQLQWAQNVSNATATVMKAGSWMSLKRVA